MIKEPLSNRLLISATREDVEGRKLGFDSNNVWSFLRLNKVVAFININFPRFFESLSSLISVWMQGESLDISQSLCRYGSYVKSTMKINEKENFFDEDDTIEIKFVHSVQSSGDDVDGKYKLSSHRPQLRITSITWLVRAGRHQSYQQFSINFRFNRC